MTAQGGTGLNKLRFLDAPGRAILGRRVIEVKQRRLSPPLDRKPERMETPRGSPG
jgi:hypothetical protein